MGKGRYRIETYQLLLRGHLEGPEKIRELKKELTGGQESSKKLRLLSENLGKRFNSLERCPEYRLESRGEGQIYLDLVGPHFDGGIWYQGGAGGRGEASCLNSLIPNQHRSRSQGLKLDGEFLKVFSSNETTRKPALRGNGKKSVLSIKSYLTNLTGAR